MTTGLIVNIDVSDVETAVTFYNEGLGIDFQRWLFEGAVAEMASGGIHIYLIQQDPGSVAVEGTDIRRDYSTHWTPVHLDVVVDDLEAALQRAIEAGAISNGEIVRSDYGRLAALRDPFGHGVCLLQFEDGGYDRVEVEAAPGVR